MMTTNDSDDPLRQQLKDRVLELTLPSDRYPSGLPKKDIAKMINRSSSMVWILQNELVKEGKLQRDPETGHIVKDKPQHAIRIYEDISKTDFIRVTSIKRWIDAMKKKPVKEWRKYVANLWKICKTLDIHPDVLLGDINEVEEMHNQFIKKFRSGEAIYIYKKKTNPNQSQANPVAYTKAIKSYRQRNGKESPSGYLTIETNSNKIYARIHLTDAERKLAIHYMSNFGQMFVDLFVLHHELGLRIDTLLRMRPSFFRQSATMENHNCIYYKVLITEKKQAEQYEKIIVTPEAKEVASRLKNGETIHNRKNISELKTEYNQRLRELYAYLGKIKSTPEAQLAYTQGTQEWYLVNEPSHAIRHSCIHKLMRLTGYRSDVVSAMFWDNPSTLEIYHKATIDEILKQGECYYCNPPQEIDPNYERFCTLRHALIYYNNGQKPKQTS